MFLFLGMIAACSQAKIENEEPIDEQTQMLSKKWRYAEMELAGEKLSGEQIGNPTMDFKADGTFEMVFGNLEESGVWSVENDTLKTETKKGGSGTNQELYIEELSDHKLVVTSMESGMQVKLVMVPVTK